MSALGRIPRLLWAIVLPVALLGLTTALLGDYFLTRPLTGHLRSQADQKLKLAAKLALAICDAKLAHLLDLRLEDAADVQSSLRKQALGELDILVEDFPHIDLLVIDEHGKLVHATSPLFCPSLPGRLSVANGPEVTCADGGTWRFRRLYFPYWRWQIYSIIPGDQYLAPSRLASRTMLLGSLCTLTGVLLILMLMIQTRVVRRLRHIIQAAGQVGRGELVRLRAGRADELGKVEDAFNHMVDGLDQGRRQVERALEEIKQNEQRHRQLIENSPSLISIVRDRRRIFVNSRVVEMTGFGRDELLGTQAMELIHPADRQKALAYSERVTRTQTAGGPIGLRYRTKTGGELWVEVRMIPFRYLGQDALLTQAIDITDQKRQAREQEELKEKLEHSQRMEVVGTLAGGVAHDFNNLLQVIGGYVDLLSREDDPDPIRRQRLTRVREAAEQGARLVKRLMTFSRKAHKVMQPVALNELVARVADLLRHTIPRMIQVQTRLDSRVDSILADPTQLEQVLLNLGNNARDAMPDGGVLSLSTQPATLDEAQCLGYLDLTPGEYIQIRVTDTGLGMEPEVVRHIFEPFFSTKEVGRGTGLGLAIVYGLVKGHQGHIVCESQPGRGTTFTIYLPATAPPQPDQPEADEHLDLDGQGEVVLLVDDEIAILEIGAEALSQAGYRPLTAPSGEKALELLERMDCPPGAVILDLNMPGMGGLRCLGHIMERWPGTRVLIASGLATHQVQNALAKGAADCILKPYSLEELLRRTRRLLDSPPPDA